MKKKVLFVIPSLSIGGAEKSLFGLLKYWDYGKYDVDVLLYAVNGEYADQLDARVTVLDDNSLFRDMFFRSVGDSVKSLIRRGRIGLVVPRIVWGALPYLCRLFRIPYHRNSAPDWKIQRKVIQRIDKQYDVAVGYMEGVSNYIVEDMIRADRKIGWIHTDYSKADPNVRLDRKILPRLDRLVTVSQNSENEILKRIPELNGKISVIPNVIDTQKIDGLTDAETPEIGNADGPVIVSVGRLVELKGFDICIEAARMLKERGQRFVWLIIGDGDQRTHLESMIERYGLSGSVILTGAKMNPYCYIKRADICVQLSRYEGRSLVVSEEQYLGKPIVASDIASFTEMIEDGRTGVIVERDPQSAADGIQRLLTDQALCGTIAENLKESGVSDLSVIRLVEKELEGQ